MARGESFGVGWGGGKAGVGMDTRVGTASPKASWDNRQNGGPGSRSSILCLPDTALATPGQEVQTVSRGPSEGGVAAVVCPSAWGRLAQGGRWVGCRFLEGLVNENPRW